VPPADVDGQPVTTSEPEPEEVEPHLTRGASPQHQWPRERRGRLMDSNGDLSTPTLSRPVSESLLPMENFKDSDSSVCSEMLCKDSLLNIMDWDINLCGLCYDYCQSVKSCFITTTTELSQSSSPVTAYVAKLLTTTISARAEVSYGSASGL